MGLRAEAELAVDDGILGGGDAAVPLFPRFVRVFRFQKGIVRFFHHSLKPDAQAGKHVLQLRILRQVDPLHKMCIRDRYGDYGKLAELGYDVSNIPTEYQKRFDLANLAGQYGDYGKLKELLGISADMQDKNIDLLYNLALAKAQLGDYSYLDKLLEQYF